MRSIRPLTFLIASFAALMFACSSEAQPSNTEGSSSEIVAGPSLTCPDPGAPGVAYISADPKKCAAILFQCEAGHDGFSDACGCGCVAKDGKVPGGGDAGPDGADAGGKRYAAYGDACLVVLIGCEEGEKYFSDQVGCGCQPK